MPLTEAEKKSILDEAEKYIIHLQVSSASIDPTRDRNRRMGYIAGRIEERERVKELVEALEWVFKKDGYQYIKDVLTNYQNSKTP